MAAVGGFVKRLGLVIVVLGLFAGFFYFYSYIFARTVKGRIENVARVTEVTALIGTRNLTESQMYSFSVSIRQPNGEMLTATSEDRQWAVAKSGLCVEAKYYPYPPWDLQKAGTYFNARLLMMADCSSSAAKEMGIDAASFGPVETAPNPQADPNTGPTVVPVGTLPSQQAPAQ